MAKHAVKTGKHAAKTRKRKNRPRRAVKSSAVSMAGVLAGALVLAPPSQPPASAAQTVHRDVLLSATIFYIDGHNYPDSGTRMAQQLSGINQYTPTCTNPATCTHLTPVAAGTNQVFIQYPAKLGLLDGPGAPTGDQSVNAAQVSLDQKLRNPPPTQTPPFTVVGYSEGAVAASHEVTAPNLPAGTAFVLIANPERPNGGILSRFPAGTYIPFVGITAGNATSANGAPVVMVTRQYDGVADAPAYPVNVLADANAFLGFYYLHGNYQSVNPNDPNNIVTHSPNGNMTDILILAPPGQLPIFMPLAQVGVPQPILVALDPAARAIIETGYNRTSDPSQQVRFGLLPPPSAWPGDAQMVVVGFVTTAELLPGAVLASVPGAAPTAKIGQALGAMPGANNVVGGVTSATSPLTSFSTAWTPVNSQLSSAASGPQGLQQQSSLNDQTNPVAGGAPLTQTPLSNPSQSPRPPTNSGPLTGAVSQLSPFAIAKQFTPSSPGSSTAAPGGRLVNEATGAVTGAVEGAVNGVTGLLGGNQKPSSTQSSTSAGNAPSKPAA